MAKKKPPAGNSGAQTINLNVSAPGANDDESDQEAFEALDREEGGALSNAIDQIRSVSGAKGDVFRLLPVDRAGFCRSYAASVFTVERIAQEYGAGRYRVRFKGPDDKYLKGGALTFDIAEGLTPAAGPNAGSGVQDLLALIKEDRAREKEERERKKSEWLEWAKLLAPLVAPKILDVFSGSKGPTLPELIAAVKDMNALQGKPNDLTQQFDQVVRILQGAKELVGDDGKATGSTWVDLIRDALTSPAVGKLVQSLPIPGVPQRQQQLPSPAAPSPAPRPAGAAPTPAANSGSAPSTAPTSSPGEAMFEQLNWLKALVETLLVQAEKNASPRLYAEVTLDNLPPFMSDQLMLERLNQANWWDQLKLLDARVGPFQAWFERYREQVLKRIHYKQRQTAAQPPVASALPGVNEPMTDESGVAHE